MADINIGTAGTTITLTANVFPKPVTFTNFGDDDMIDVPDFENVQYAIGVDKKATAWTEQVVVTSTITLAPNSPIIKEALIPIQQTQKITDSAVVCTISVVIPTLKQQWIFPDVVLKSGSTPGTLKKKVELRKFTFASRPPEYFPLI